MSRRWMAYVPGFRAWTAGRYGTSVSIAAVLLSQALLWLWRGRILGPAMFSGPWPLALAAWTSVLCVCAAVLMDRVATPAAGRRGRHPQPPAQRIAVAICTAYIALGLLAPALTPQDPNRIGDGIATQNLPPLSQVHILTLRDGSTFAARAVEVDGDIIRTQRGSTWTRTPRAELRGTRPEDWHELRRHWLGTDHLGRDLLSRLVAATPVSLGIGLAAAVLAMALGALVGGLAGVARPAMDSLLMRLTDTFLAFPRLFLVLLVLTVIPGSLPAAVLVLAATGWMVPARLVRSSILALRQQDFVQAAHAAGRSRTGILLHHLLPHAVAPLLVAASLRVGETMLVEAGLSFLGLGVPPPHASWGNLIAGARPALAQAWWVAVFPGVMLTGAVLAFNVLADGLRQVMARR